MAHHKTVLAWGSAIVVLVFAALIVASFLFGDSEQRTGALAAMTIVVAVLALGLARYLATPQPFDLGAVDIRADHVVAEVGEARPGHEADVAGSDNSDFHSSKKYSRSRGACA